jgi:hypothetical protein
MASAGNPCADGAADDEGGSDSTGVLQILKIAKIPKLLRLGRLFKLLEKIEGAGDFAMIMVLVVLLMLLVHIFCSLWYLVAGGENTEKPETGWIVATEVTDEDGNDVALYDAPIWTQFTMCYYTTLMMLMGDAIDFTNNSEGVFAICLVLFGAFVNATIFANVSSLVLNMGQNSARHKNQMDGIGKAMRQLNVPVPVATRVRAYFEYLWTRHRDHAGDAFIMTLPGPLRTRVSILVHGHCLLQCPLFKEVDDRLVSSVAAELRPEVYLPTEFVLVAGAQTDCMYFIQTGKVSLIMPREASFAAASEGRRDSLADAMAAVKTDSVPDSMQMEERSDQNIPYFNELAVFNFSQRSLTGGTLSARALTHCDLYKLQSSRFKLALQATHCALSP